MGVRHNEIHDLSVGELDPLRHAPPPRKRSAAHNALIRPLLLGPALALGLYHQAASWVWLATATAAAAVSVLLTVLGDGYWTRFSRLRTQFFLDITMVVSICMNGMGAVHLPHVAALNFLLPLLVATLTETQLRLTEVSSAAAVVTSAWVLSNQQWGVLSLASTLTLTLLNGLLVWGWWNRPLRLYQVQAVRLYAHELRGFLAALSWSAQLDDPTMSRIIEGSIRQKIEESQNLETLLSSVSKRQWPRCFDAAPLLRSMLRVESSSPLPIRASTDRFTGALVALGLAVPTAPDSTAQDNRSLRLCWAVNSNDFVAHNAALMASQTLDLPHRVILSQGRLELRIRLHRHGPLRTLKSILSPTRALNSQDP